jgi:Putative MetA-pathway of phenol degradation
MTIHKLLMLGPAATALRLFRPSIGIRRQEWSVPHSTTVTVTSSVRFLRLVPLLAASLASLSGASKASAAECTQRSDPIETDRPDTTDSSVVVPVGSFQNENGINLNRRESALVFDGTNSRLRLGIAPCLEVLVDLPTDVTAFRGPGASGFTNVVPAVKWQISPIPEKFDLSMTAGVGLPTGAVAIAGPGMQPYLQFPWSMELGSGWAITGMVTNFFIPADPVNRYINQSTFVIERHFGKRAFLFAEYVGEFPLVGATSQLFNSGGGYRITDTQQIDFHVAFGLNRNAPAYIFGIGYSFRIDGLF